MSLYAIQMITLTPLRMPTVTKLMKEYKNELKNRKIILGLGYSNTVKISSCLLCVVMTFHDTY